MNIAIIFAGGTGQRMNTKTKPKQFLELHGKPILVYTLEQFQQHERIDGIVIASLENYIEYCWQLVRKYDLTKVTAIVPGGENGQMSIFNGLKKAGEMYSLDSAVLIHDGVRPLIDQETISKCLDCLDAHGSAVTVTPATETITLKGEHEEIDEIIERSRCQMARAPQCFILKDILEAHQKAQQEGRMDFIDSSCLMRHYGHKLYSVEGKPENIKITTPSDFYIFRAIMDARENSQILGI